MGAQVSRWRSSDLLGVCRSKRTYRGGDGEGLIQEEDHSLQVLAAAAAGQAPVMALVLDTNGSLSLASTKQTSQMSAIGDGNLKNNVQPKPLSSSYGVTVKVTEFDFG